MKVQEGSWKGWEVHIETKDGKRLAEHSARTKTSETRTEFYVECEHDTEFLICVNGPYSADDTRLDFRVDGAWLAPKIYAGTRGKVYRFGRAFERAGGELRERSLVFRKLVRNIEVSRVLTAKERRKDAPKLPRSQEPGSIAVTLRHGTYTYADYVYVPPITVLGERKVHTSHKKVPDTYVGAGPYGPVYNDKGVACLFTRSTNVPEHIFAIKYATRDALIADGIIPTPLPDVPPFDIFCEKTFSIRGLSPDIPVAKTPSAPALVLRRPWCWWPFSAIITRRKCKKDKTKTPKKRIVFGYEKSASTSDSDTHSVHSSDSEDTLM